MDLENLQSLANFQPGKKCVSLARPIMGPKKAAAKGKADDEDGGGGDDFDEMVNSTFTYQILAGGAFGLAGGYMDATYIEPFGYIFGGSLALLQLLDHRGVVSLCWMDDGGGAKKKGKKNIIEEAKEFSANNVHVACGFAAGFVLGHYYVENCGA